MPASIWLRVIRQHCRDVIGSYRLQDARAFELWMIIQDEHGWYRVVKRIMNVKGR